MTLQSELTDAVSAFYRDYQSALNAQDAEMRETLEPGQRYTPGRRLEGKHREAFEETAARRRDDAQDVVERVRKKIVMDVTEPPTAEGAAAIQMLSTRDNIGADELAMYYERFGGNTATRRALDAIAVKQRHWGLLVSTDSRAEAFESLQRVVDRMRTTDVEASYLSPSTLASVDAEVIADGFAGLGGIR